MIHMYVMRTFGHNPPRDEWAVQSITLRTSDNEFVEGAVHCLLCLLSRAETDKCTLLFGDHVKVPDLTKLVEVVPANQGTTDDNP